MAKTSRKKNSKKDGLELFLREMNPFARQTTLTCSSLSIGVHSKKEMVRCLESKLFPF